VSQKGRYGRKRAKLEAVFSMLDRRVEARGASAMFERREEETGEILENPRQVTPNEVYMSLWIATSSDVRRKKLPCLTLGT